MRTDRGSHPGPSRITNPAAVIVPTLPCARARRQPTATAARSKGGQVGSNSSASSARPLTPTCR